MSAKRKAARKQQQPDAIWGIDRYPSSPAFGELVLEKVNLWQRVGGITAGDNHVIATLPHGYRVVVTQEKQHEGQVWCRVEVAAPRGEESGWLRATLLEKRGQKEFEE